VTKFSFAAAEAEDLVFAVSEGRRGAGSKRCRSAPGDDRDGGGETVHGGGRHRNHPASGHALGLPSEEAAPAERRGVGRAGRGVEQDVVVEGEGAARLWQTAAPNKRRGPRSGR